MTSYNPVNFIMLHMLQNCFTLPVLPINAYFHSVFLDYRSFYQYAIIYVRKKKFSCCKENLVCFVMLLYGTFNDNE